MSLIVQPPGYRRVPNRLEVTNNGPEDVYIGKPGQAVIDVFDKPAKIIPPGSKATIDANQLILSKNGKSDVTVKEKK